jgi:hypothetical protein
MLKTGPGGLRREDKRDELPMCGDTRVAVVGLAEARIFSCAFKNNARKTKSRAWRPSQVILKGTPVPGALETLSKATHTRGLGSLSWGLDRLGGRDVGVGALAVASAGPEMLPLAEGAVATIAGAVPMALWMKTRELVKPDLVAGMLPAEDAATLATMVAPLKEAEGFFA